LLPARSGSVWAGKRGPAPAHRIPIWIGAHRPRMQRLVGRKADGWLPSLGRLEPGALTAGNRAIDEAAVAAGRDPRETRRILNVSGEFAADAADAADTTDTTSTLHGPSAHWVEVPGQLAVQDGIDTFVRFSDDPRTLEQFAEEVIPALREIAGQR